MQQHAFTGSTEVAQRINRILARRAAVLCVAASVRALLNQFAAVFSTENRPCVMASREDLIPACLRDEIRSIDDIDQLGADCHFALVQDSLADTIRVALAARDGALVAVREIRDEESIPVWCLVAERVLCVNTTAAGGNASLMTLEA